MSKTSQSLKVLRLMARYPNREWWKAVDWQQPNTPRDCWIGYEATARMSDILREYPQVVVSKRDGKYRLLALRINTIEKLNAIDIDTKAYNVLMAELMRHDRD